MMASNLELYRIYICNLPPDVERDYLKLEFDIFGEICYFHFHADKGYTLISYTNQKDAILAIAKGNNMIIRGCPIQVQWARGYPRNRDRYKDFSFDTVYYSSSPSNCIVYCSGGLGGPNSKNLLLSTFGPFGEIQEIYIKINKFHTDNAMIQFSTNEEAALAICTIDGTQVEGHTVSCTWCNRPISHFLERGWQSIGGYEAPSLPTALPPAFNSSSVSRSTLRTPAASSLASRTPAASSLASRSPAASSLASRTPAASSLASKTPVASGTLSNFSSELFSLQMGMFKLAQNLREWGFTPPLTSASTATSSIRPDNVTTSTSSTTIATQRPNVSAATNISSASSNQEYTNDDFDTVFDETGPSNCVVYCEGLNRNTTVESLKEIFNPFGIVEEINLHVDRSDYALIRFNTKEAATLAICSINNSKINGRSVKCSWSNRLDDQVQIASVGYLELCEPVTTSTQSRPPPFCLPSASSTASSLSAATSAISPKQDKSSESEKVKKRNTDIFCKICMDEELGVVFLPCGHLTSCSKCAEKIHFCPLCRELITSKVRTYLS